MPDQNFIELRRIIAAARHWWLLIGGVTIFAVLLALIVTSIMPPVYESSAMLLVNPSKNSNTNQYNDLMAGTQLALTYSQMITDRPVLEAVISDLGLKISPDALAEQITAQPVRNSQIIKLTVADKDPERAALIANTLARTFTKRVEELSAMRYAGEIQNAKVRMDTLQTQIGDLQTQADTLRTKKVTKDVALANKQTLLATYQSDYRSLQNNYQDMQLMVAEVTGKVYIVEPVQVQKVPISGTAVISIGQAQSGGSGLGGNLALTYGQLMTTQPVLQKVIDDLGLSETTEQLAKKVTLQAVIGTQLIRVTVADLDGSRAKLITQSLVDAFIAQVKALLSEPYLDRLKSVEKQIGDMEASINSAQDEIGKLTSEIAQMATELDRLEIELSAARSDYREALQGYQQIQTTTLQESDAVIVTEFAQAPKSPSRNRMMYILVAAFLGLVIGAGIAFSIEFFNGKIRTGQDVRSALNLTVLSTIRQLPGNDADLIMDLAPDSDIAEDFRVLGNKLRLISENNSIKTLMITSPVPTEGKSIITSNLAISLSRMGMRIVLVDADLRLPRVRYLFGLDEGKGLANSLSEGKIDGALQSTGVGNLQVVTSGTSSVNPAELLSSQHLSKLLEELEKQADLVLIDCSPVLVASDASILASKVDGVLLVLRSGSSESKEAQDAVEALEQVSAKLIGVVLNSVPDHRRSYYYYRRA